MKNIKLLTKPWKITQMLKLYRTKSYRQITEKKINSYNCTLNVQKAIRAEHDNWDIQKIFKSSFYRLKGTVNEWKKVHWMRLTLVGKAKKIM